MTSLMEIGRCLGSNTILGMGLKVGLTSPFKLSDLIRLTPCFSYVTQHCDNARTGWNHHEVKLTIETVRSPKFGVLFSQNVDGKVYAQPLYMRNLVIPGQGMHNVVFVATENDSIYAFDADTKIASYLWKAVLLGPGEQAVPSTDVTTAHDVLIYPTLGITSTPVIDRASNTLYCTSFVKGASGASDDYHLRLHALDLATGLDKAGSPIEVKATVPGNGDGSVGGMVSLSQRSTQVPQTFPELNRPGLLLLNGQIYLGFGSYTDEHPFHGWILSYDAVTLQQIGKLCLTANDSGGSVWQAGQGLAGDAEGNVYFTTGNGGFDANKPDGTAYSDCVVKLASDLSVADYFAPCNQQDLRQEDADLAAGGVMILPDQPAGAGVPRKLLVTCGKEGVIYIIDRENMGKYNDTGGGTRPCTDNVVSRSAIPAVGTNTPATTGGPSASDNLFGGPSYYAPSDPFASIRLVYYCGNGDALKAFAIDVNGQLSANPFAQSTNKFASASGDYPGPSGSTPCVSSDGRSNRTAIVWAINRTDPLELYAYDAIHLGDPLFHPMSAGPWPPGGAPQIKRGGAFVVPTVINGKVYVGSDGQLTVFGLTS